jgi:hypothetical protein
MSMLHTGFTHFMLATRDAVVERRSAQATGADEGVRGIVAGSPKSSLVAHDNFPKRA